MNPRHKKLLGVVILPVALLLYFGVVVSLADRLPSFWLVQLIYFIVTGLAWAIPTIPFIRWMEKSPAPRPQSEPPPNGQ